MRENGVEMRGSYVIGTDAILLKAYRLHGLFATNEVLARRYHPKVWDQTARSLEKRFFEIELASLLIEIAAALRVLFDQRLDPTDQQHAAFEQRQMRLMPLTIMVIDPPPKPSRSPNRTQPHPSARLNLRFACNKIIHANEVQPLWRDAWEVHEWDIGARLGVEERQIKWQSLSGEVRLSGVEQRARWVAVLHIEPFIQAIAMLLLD